MAGDLKKRVGQTKFKKVQTASSTGTDTSEQRAIGTSSQTAESLQTQKNREKVNIGFQVTFTVLNRQITPAAPGGGSC